MEARPHSPTSCQEEVGLHPGSGRFGAGHGFVAEFAPEPGSIKLGTRFRVTEMLV